MDFFKEIWQKVLIFFLIVVILPIYLLLSILILIFSGRPIFFIQKRVGKDGKIFNIYKFRTMRVGAEKEQKKYCQMNEADGPVFKIKNDPRFTKIGKFLCHTGFDELPQFFNILKGDMNLVGPRPLPINEEKLISEKYRVKRQSIKPGIISTWVVNGYHKMSFDKWMKNDIKYVENKSFIEDLKLSIKSIKLIVRLFIREIHF